MTDTAPIPQDWKDRDAVEAWLRTQPRAVCAILAARAALRVLPLIEFVLLGQAEWARRAIVLPLHRATAPAWLAAVGPIEGVAGNVADAADAAERAIIGKDDISRAARAAALAALAARAIADAEAAARPSKAAMENLIVNAARVAALTDVAVMNNLMANALRADDQTDHSARVALTADASALEADPTALSHAALWLNETPPWAEQAWSRLRKRLHSADEKWEVWTAWYDARLRGDPVDVELETRRVIEPKRWDDGPAAVNAEIAAIIADHESRKAAAIPPAVPDETRRSIEVQLETPALRSAYADFEVDTDTATVRMVPMPGDMPVLPDADLALDWRSRLEGLAIQPLDLIEHIRDARCNVPQALLKDLARYAHEAERGPDAVRPGVLDLFGRNLIAAGEIEDITAALGDYLGGTLARIGDAHRRLMRDYHAQVTSRLDAAPVTLPEDATPTAVADAVEAVSESLQREPWGGLRAERDFTDLLDAQKEAFRAAAASLDLTDDAAQRRIILDSIKADEARTLATISRFALRVRQAVGSNSKLAQRIGYAADLHSLYGAATQIIQKVLGWIGLG